jgi:hypothetical protein
LGPGGVARRIGLTVVWLLLLAGCAAGAKGPNLDRALPGMPEASIREKIAGHQDWGNRLTPGQLDLLASYLHEVAGATPGAGPSVPTGGPIPAEPPGLVLWRANACGTCHALAAAGGG